jgi:hypothetical protein
MNGTERVVRTAAAGMFRVRRRRIVQSTEACCDTLEAIQLPNFRNWSSQRGELQNGNSSASARSGGSHLRVRKWAPPADTRMGVSSSSPNKGDDE